MKKIFAHSACIFSLLIYSSPAFSTEATALSVSRIGDTELMCGQLSQEATLMRDIVMTTEDIKGNTELRRHGITAAGALGSFLISSVTGGLGIAAAGFLLQQTAEEKSDYADGIQDIAKQRRSLMVGIYNAKGCNGPIEHAFQDYINDDPNAFDPLRLASVEPAAGEEDVEEKPRFNQ